jgi:hypothetical protein
MPEMNSEIERRMVSGEPFTFGHLWIGKPDPYYRVADRLTSAGRC